MDRKEAALWMGSLEVSYMDERFIRNMFTQLGLTASISRVEMIKNRDGEQVGYCYVHFTDLFFALETVHRFNGKRMPDTDPPINFFLNLISIDGRLVRENLFVLYVGDLSSIVTDYILYRGFADRYRSVRRAVVKQSENSYIRGYGCVHFANEEEQRHALINMQNWRGIGVYPIRVSLRLFPDTGDDDTNSPNDPPNNQSTDVSQATSPNDPPNNQSNDVAQPTSNGEPQPSTSATMTQQAYFQYYQQYLNNCAAIVGASRIHENYNVPRNPEYNNAQQQPTLPQSGTNAAAAAAYQNRLLMAMQAAQSSVYLGQQEQQQQQPTPEQIAMMSGAYQGAEHPEPTGIPTNRRRSSEEVDEQENDDDEEQEEL